MQRRSGTTLTVRTGSAGFTVTLDGAWRDKNDNDAEPPPSRLYRPAAADAEATEDGSWFVAA